MNMRDLLLLACLMPMMAAAQQQDDQIALRLNEASRQLALSAEADKLSIWALGLGAGLVVLNESYRGKPDYNSLTTWCVVGMGGTLYFGGRFASAAHKKKAAKALHQ